jgi:hypothetical protein
MATAADIITAAFGKIEVISPTAAQNASALINLNNMVSMLGADMLAPYIVTESLALVIADAEYTIGSGGQWNTTRPMRVDSCYLRDADDYDHPVEIISSKDYAKYSSKSFSARPTELVFLPEYPLAKIIFNTMPDMAYDGYFEFLKGFTEFATSATTVTLPNEYKEALVYNLAVSLGEDWGRNIPNTVVTKAEQYKEIIGRLNAASRKVPRAKFDFVRTGPLIGDYNVVSDESIDGGAF